MEHMRCNRCGTQMAPTSQVIAATCHHMFCTKCAQDLLDAGEPCPMCEGSLTRSNLKQVTILQNSSNLSLSLCGQTPHTIMEAALSGIKFYTEQQHLNAQYEQNILSKKFTNMQNQCKVKLEQVHQGYTQAKRKYQDTVQERNAMQQDIEELKQKYAQKAQQTRKLQEMVKALQQEHEDIKRRCLSNRGSGGQVVMHAGVAGQLGNLSGGARQPSPFSSGAHVVTTVQQHRSVVDLSPSAGVAACGGSYGHNMFSGTGTSPAMQRRPGTGSGGMFGNAGNMKGPGGGVGGGGGMRGLGLGSPGGMLSI